LIDAQQGRGAFVRLRPSVRRVQAPLKQVTEEAPGADGRQRITDARPAAVWGAVADLLGVAEGAHAFVRSRVVLTATDDPIELGADYFPLVQLPADRPVSRTASLLAARMPSPAEAATLQMPAGVPLLEVLTASYDADGVPIQVIERLLPGDRFAIYDEQPSAQLVITEEVPAPHSER
jgi:DNA-binding GntR family transcriptional regulator